MKKPNFALVSVLLFSCITIASKDYTENTYENKYEQYIRENNIPIYYDNGVFTVNDNIKEEDLLQFLGFLELNRDIIIDNINNTNTTRTAEGGPYKRTVLTIINGQIFIEKDNGPNRIVYEPTHPDAYLSGDMEGYVEYPNVDIVLELTDLIEVCRIREQIIEALY